MTTRARDATPQARFSQQRKQANRRGIEWLLTYEQWIDIWLSSGKWAYRGKNKGQYVMARRGDVGPYSVDNVYICLHSENIKDGYRNKPGKCGGHLILGSGRGWHIANGKYLVSVRGKMIGKFDTQQDAEAAYKAKVAEIKAAA